MPTLPKMQHCFYCGDELGVYVHVYSDGPECCGKRECQRELCAEMRRAEEERMDRAREDHYERY